MAPGYPCPSRPPTLPAAEPVPSSVPRQAARLVAPRPRSACRTHRVQLAREIGLWSCLHFVLGDSACQAKRHFFYQQGHIWLFQKEPKDSPPRNAATRQSYSVYLSLKLDFTPKSSVCCPTLKSPLLCFFLSLPYLNNNFN